MIEILIGCIFISYIITRVITGSTLLTKARLWLIDKHKLLDLGCRMCIGMWVSLAVTITTYGIEFEMSKFLIIYGASYFLTTQEKGGR